MRIETKEKMQTCKPLMLATAILMAVLCLCWADSAKAGPKWKSLDKAEKGDAVLIVMAYLKALANEGRGINEYVVDGFQKAKWFKKKQPIGNAQQMPGGMVDVEAEAEKKEINSRANRAKQGKVFKRLWKKYDKFDFDKPVRFLEIVKNDEALVKVKLSTKSTGSKKTLSFKMKHAMRKSTKKSKEIRPLLGMHGDVEWYWLVAK